LDFTFTAGIQGKYLGDSVETAMNRCVNGKWRKKNAWLGFVLIIYGLDLQLLFINSPFVIGGIIPGRFRMKRFTPVDSGLGRSTKKTKPREKHFNG